MRAQSNQATDPLLAGFFSMPEAARLVGANQAVVRGWLNGYPNSALGPIVQRDFEGTRSISFLDLMELRFIRLFRMQGVPMSTLREAAERARRDWHVTHPLAMSNEHYVTDRRTVFAAVAQENQDQETWDMATGQHQMWDIIEQTIAKGVTFEPITYQAKSWKPKSVEFPDVIIDPHFAFGREIIEGTGVPTIALFDQWKAEGNKDRVADWFEVPVSAVSTAIEYQLALSV